MQPWHVFAGIFLFIAACFFYEYGKGQHRLGNETFLTPVFMMGLNQDRQVVNRQVELHG